MQDFTKKAISIKIKLRTGSYEDNVKVIAEALNEAYNLGKKHLIEPHLLMGGEYQPIIEKDTYNPQA